MTRDAPQGGDAASISEQLPRRRRRLGLALVVLGVAALAAQSWVEWLLPYDLAALETMRRLSGQPTLSPAQLVWAWALLCSVLLLGLASARARSLMQTQGLALLCGLALGSAHVAAGGPAASSAMLMLVGVASLGWHALARRWAVAAGGHGRGRGGWDATLSGFPTLWLAATVLGLMFVWIDRMHIRANDRRLFSALAERDELITSLDQHGEQLTALQGARTRLLASISHDLRQPLQAVRLFAEALQARPDPDDPQAEQRPNSAASTCCASRCAPPTTPWPCSTSSASSAPSNKARCSRTRRWWTCVMCSTAWPPTCRPPTRVSSSASPCTAAASGATPTARSWRAWCRTWPATPCATAWASGPANGRAWCWRCGRTRRQRLPASSHQGLAIDIVDNGRGIPPDKLEAVFEPYVQLADGAGGASRGGRGLGLAIVRGLVAQLGPAAGAAALHGGPRHTFSRVAAGRDPARRARRSRPRPRPRHGAGRRPGAAGRLAAGTAGRRSRAARGLAGGAGRRGRHHRRRGLAAAAEGEAGRRAAFPGCPGL